MNHPVRKSDFENSSDFIEPGFYLCLNKDRKQSAGIGPVHVFNSFEYRLKQGTDTKTYQPVQGA